MDRRTFTRHFAGGLLGPLAISRGSSILRKMNFSWPSHDVMTQSPLQLSVMLWTVFTDLPFAQRLEKIAQAGYHSVELVAEYERWTDADFAAANAKAKELGIRFDCTAGLKHGVSIPGERPALLAELRQVLPIMQRLTCPSIILLSGNRIPNLSREQQHQCCVDTLRAAARLIEGRSIDNQPVRLFLETIDPEENPHYFLTTIAEALQVVQEVDHPQVQLLYDFYHEQIAAGNLIEQLEMSIPHLGLVHIADVPGRHQPGTGEINYENIYRKLAQIKYKGVVAMEFHPIGDPIEQLRIAREMAVRCASEAVSAAPSL